MNDTTIEYGGLLSDYKPPRKYAYCGSCRIAYIDDSGIHSNKQCPHCGFLTTFVNEEMRQKLGLKPFDEWEE